MSLYPTSGPILNRLRQVGGLDVFGASQVGDGARHFEDAVVGAGAHLQLLHGRPEQGYLPRPGPAPAPDQSSVADSMVGGTKGTMVNEGGIRGQHIGHGVDDSRGPIADGVPRRVASSRPYSMV